MPRLFSFHPSNCLTLLLVLAHTAAAGAFSLVPLPKPALSGVLVVLLGSMVYYVLRDARLTLGSAWVGLELDGDRVVLSSRKGDELTGELLRSSVVTPYLVVLNIAVSGQHRRRNVVLMPDSMEAESFRQLRVALKWGAVPTV